MDKKRGKVFWCNITFDFLKEFFFLKYQLIINSFIVKVWNLTEVEEQKKGLQLWGRNTGRKGRTDSLDTKNPYDSTHPSVIVAWFFNPVLILFPLLTPKKKKTKKPDNARPHCRTNGLTWCGVERLVVGMHLNSKPYIYRKWHDVIHNFRTLAKKLTKRKYSQIQVHVKKVR